jgi:hypothetical protein
VNLLASDSFSQNDDVTLPAHKTKYYTGHFTKSFTMVFQMLLCESAFSYLKRTESEQRSSMTDEYLQDSLQLALTQYSPDFQQMMDEMQAQTSH